MILISLDLGNFIGNEKNSVRLLNEQKLELKND